MMRIKMKNPPLDQTGGPRDEEKENSQSHQRRRRPKPLANLLKGQNLIKGLQWISDLSKQADFCSSFNELMDTPMDFSAFLMNRLKVDTLTPKLLAGPTYELIKGSCKSLVELKFLLKDVYKTTTDQLD
nr:hypothetical protein [Tanacetum cinerariifolium]